jgi:hypothetical protein
VSEQDLHYDGELDDAVQFIERAAVAMGGTVVLNDFAADLRAGYLEVEQTPVADVVIMQGEPGTSIVRVDVRTEPGQRLFDRVVSQLSE